MSAQVIEMDDGYQDAAELQAAQHREVCEAWERIEARERAILKLAPKYGAAIKADIDYDLTLVRGALSLNKGNRWND